MFQHHLKWTGALVVLIGALSSSTPPVLARAQTPADNTKVNKRDQAKGAVTADQQKNDKSDLELTRQIRKALVADKSLSTYAHNVKVVSQSGQVTLKGPVRSQEEKTAVEAMAVQVAGAEHVSNQMSIAPPKK